MDPHEKASRVLALDGWRGVAILLVLVGHFFPVPGVDLGRLGVEAFFVLSGRLMADILFVKKAKLPEFFYRRASRILPALAAFAGLYWLFGMIAGPPFQLSFVWVIASLTFTINYMVLAVHGTGWFDHVWSLCVEEHSYMLLGFLAFVLGRVGVRPLLAIWALAVLAMANGLVGTLVLGLPFDFVYYRSDVHLASVFVSAAIYLTLRHRVAAGVVQRVATPLFALCLPLGVVLSVDGVPPELSYTVGTVVLALAVAVVDVVARPVVAVLSAAPLRTAGLLSYSLYLWQQPFYKAHVELQGAHVLIYLLGAIATGLASYYLVENPARLWLNARWKTWRARASPGAQAAATEAA